MNILIVDDEQHVIDAIKYLIDWDDYPPCTVLEAHNGEEAMGILNSESIDVVFTDMQMPKMDGMTFLKQLIEEKNPPQIIAVSNHSNFEYMRQVVQSGGIDYILKPVDPVQINEAFSKAIEEVKKRTKTVDNNIKVNAYTPIYFSKLMSEIINHRSQDKYKLKQIKEHYDIQGDSLGMGILYLPDSQVLARKVFGGDISLMFFSVTNVCNEIVGKERGITFRYQPREDHCIVLYWGEKDAFRSQLKKIRDTLMNLFTQEVIVGVSEFGFPLNDLCLAYEEAVHAIKNRNVLDEDIDVWTSRQLNYKFPYEEWLKTYNELIKKVSNEERKLLDTDMKQELLKSIARYPYVTIHDLKELNAMVIREYGEKQDIDLQQGEKSIDSLGDFIDLLNIYGELIQQQMQKSHQDEQVDLVQKTVDYIETHYKEPLSLAQLAESFYVSKEHLSRQFKKKVGKTLSEYITDKKMTEGIRLLRESQRSIKDIATMLGYNDEKYFSKVFKKYFKQSPRQCREKKED